MLTEVELRLLLICGMAISASMIHILELDRMNWYGALNEI